MEILWILLICFFVLTATGRRILMWMLACILFFLIWFALALVSPTYL